MNIVGTYTSLYDEIVQGYENGTRKVNVADGESETGYRTLTLEEELNVLDEPVKRLLKQWKHWTATVNSTKSL